ncbi:uncharacterized protein N7483_009790 [Penicillium malachiteum]|uniref:uncharacterized protein n=1 Tax=Penicillium malachiteum TaxID=1324776 RepID=UPI0025472A91|nr:uncharacterized protein N7483_009790 [Penicillium malachiteum]KAJ5721856.1 hypothetical protein N7483_009790 [Penicillium malachiteum]
MSPPNLPGFYWDPEKKKYFKIEANHAASSSSSYSTDRVKRKRDDEEKAVERKIFDQRVANERIRRSSLVSHPFTTAQRELGIQQPNQTVTQGQICQTYLHGLEKKHLYTFDRPWKKEYHVGQIVRIPETGTLITAGNRGMDCTMSFVNPTSFENNQLEYNRARANVHFTRRSRVTSLSLSHTGFMLLTMDCGSHGESTLKPFTPPHSASIANPPEHFYDQDIPCGTDMLCSAACPEGSVPIFALGTSKGLCVMRGDESGWSFTWPHKPPRHLRQSSYANMHTTVPSVDWLSGSVVLGGRQDSAVLVYDTRARDTVTRFQHPEPVTKVRKVDANRVVVMGQRAMNMYDMRFPINGVQGTPNPIDGPQPYVDARLGLLVNATAGGQVRMYSLTSGKVVYSLDAHDAKEDCLGVVGFEQSTDQGVRAGEAPALLFGHGSHVSQLAW